MKPKNRLRMNKIDRIALVDKGDNPGADIVIHKRASEKPADAPAKENEMESKEKISLVKSVMKALGLGDEEVIVPEPKETPVAEEPTVADTVTKEQISALEKRVADAEADAKARAEEVTKLRTEARNAEYVTKAASFKHLPIKADEFGPVLRKIADGEKLTEDEVKEIDRVLNAANEASRTAKLFEEAGASGPVEGSAQAEAEAKANAYRTAEPKLTAEQALTKVWKENPELRKRVEDEERTARNVR